LYFVDGTHPSYTAHAAYGWIRKGKTWELKRACNPVGVVPGSVDYGLTGRG
jgi:hypothetical protein